MFDLYRKLVSREQMAGVDEKAVTETDQSIPSSQANVQADTERPVLPPKITIPRDSHPISRRQLSKNALKVLYRLKDAGFDAYLVGGCIRDLLLGIKPKDFDVVTNAKPEEIKALFNNCRLIGRRFRLAHIVYGREIIEVATFRGHHDQAVDDAKKKNISSHSDEGLILRDNIYGSIEEDAERRDFSINALYYSINDFSIIDYANGVEAIHQRKIDIIGDPETRYREDPVRMLRAIRFASKLDMTIAPETAEPIERLGHLLSNIPAARLYEEALKLFLSGDAEANYKLLRQYKLFRYLFPVIQSVLNGDPDSKEERLIRQVFINTDERIRNNKKVTPAFLYAALLWYPLEAHTLRLVHEGGLRYYDAFQIACNEVLEMHCRHSSLPRRFSTPAREIWQLQLRLPKTSGRRAFRLIEHPKFRAAYDFLLVRAQIEGGDLKPLADWWTNFQESDEVAQQTLANKPSGGRNQGKSSSNRNNKNYRPRRRSQRNRQGGSGQGNSGKAQKLSNS